MVLLTICLIFFGLALLGVPLVWSLLATSVATIWMFSRPYPLEAIFLIYIDGVQPLYLAGAITALSLWPHAPRLGPSRVRRSQIPPLSGR